MHYTEFRPRAEQDVDLAALARRSGARPAEHRQRQDESPAGRQRMTGRRGLWGVASWVRRLDPSASERPPELAAYRLVPPPRAVSGVLCGGKDRGPFHSAG
jgi:hypothetical protein